jgi:hypothetical protein
VTVFVDFDSRRRLNGYWVKSAFGMRNDVFGTRVVGVAPIGRGALLAMLCTYIRTLGVFQQLDIDPVTNAAIGFLMIRSGY